MSSQLPRDAIGDTPRRLMRWAKRLATALDINPAAKRPAPAEAQVKTPQQKDSGARAAAMSTSKPAPKRKTGAAAMSKDMALKRAVANTNKISSFFTKKA